MGLELRGVICSSSTTWTAAEAHRNEDHSDRRGSKQEGYGENGGLPAFMI